MIGFSLAEYTKRKAKCLPFCFAVVSVFFICFQGLELQSQSLEIGWDIDREGNVILPKDLWILPNEKGFLSAGFHSPDTIADSLLTLEISRQRIGAWDLIWKKSYSPPGKKHWAGWQFPLSESGYYKAVVMDSNRQILAEKEFRTIVREAGEGRELFKDVSVNIWEHASGRKGAGRRDTFAYSHSKDSVWVLVDDLSGTFKCKQIITCLRRGNETSTACIIQEKYRIRPDWNFFSFSMVLPEPGIYDLFIFNDEYIFISSKRLVVQ